jgi:BirA family biotin operon repressor/biotin-[acetyl-CoA-carboxylase] ligase
VVARPAIEPASTAMITLAVGLGVREAVARWVPERRVLVKWPNDVWIERKKCAGVLVESRTVGSSIDSVVIGVGINVNRTEWPVELAGTATSLRMERPTDDEIDRERVFADALSDMETWVDRFATGGGSAIVAALEPHLALVGTRIAWEAGVGVFEGVDPTGVARVRTNDGIELLRAARLQPFEAS